MNNKMIIGISAASALCAIFVALWYKDVIVFRFSSHSLSQSQVQSHYKKLCRITFSRRGQWAHESVELMLNESRADTIARIANAWLNLLDQEGIIKKRVLIESVLMSADQKYAYVSFDRNLFDKSLAAYQKLLLLEGLLKTWRENGVVLQGIYFQAHHQPLQDYHLDFSNAWPLLGFLQK